MSAGGRSPITATAVNGRVIIDAAPETARDLMDAFWAAHEASAELQADRPGWFGDVVELLRAAGEADVQAAASSARPVMVPLVRPERPRLRVVVGGAS